MSALPLAVLAQLALSCPAGSSFPPGHLLDRVEATAATESGLDTTAVHDNSTGQSYFPASEAEAITLVRALRVLGHSLDAGVMQVNDANWQRLGLTPETVFNARANVCAGMAVLAEDYRIERRVSCRYNTGRPDCDNGYPERIEGALNRLRARSISVPMDQATAAMRSAEASIGSKQAARSLANPFVGHRQARELTFVPAFSTSAAPPHDGPRPAEPAVPASPITAPAQPQRKTAYLRSTTQ